jgi:hypothetical protein
VHLNTASRRYRDGDSRHKVPEELVSPWQLAPVSSMPEQEGSMRSFDTVGSPLNLFVEGGLKTCAVAQRFNQAATCSGKQRFVPVGRTAPVTTKGRIGLAHANPSMSVTRRARLMGATLIGDIILRGIANPEQRRRERSEREGPPEPRHSDRHDSGWVTGRSARRTIAPTRSERRR